MADDSILSQLSNLKDSEIDGVTPPSQKLVDWLLGAASHSRAEDLLHQLGMQDGDASDGAHIHDGKKSRKILSPEKVTLTDLSGSPSQAAMNTAINKLNAALRILGAG